MDAFLLIAIGTVVAVFVVTAVFTLVAIVKIRGKTWITFVDVKYRDRLFHVLILEVVAICLSIATYALKGITHLQKQVEKIQQQLVLNEEDWANATKGWIDQPSGVSFTNLTDSRYGKPLVAIVDDDEPFIFIVQPVDFDGAVAARRGIPLFFKQEALTPNDAEAITFDGERFYYLITSFRRLNKPKECQLLKFEIDRVNWERSDYRIAVDKSYDLQGALKDFLRKVPRVNIDVNQWQDGKGKDANNEFSVEIEGLAWVEGNLWIGLKWPLVNEDNVNKAIILVLTGDGSRFERYHLVDLGGRGISDLFYAQETGTLYIAANPPGKPRDEPSVDAQTDRKALYGHSSIFGYALDKAGNLPTREDRVSTWNFSNGKLEGVTRVNNEWWMVYEGEEPRFIRRKIDD